MIRRILATMLVALAAGGCAAPKTAQEIDPQFATRNIIRIALAPVVFADEPFDRYFGNRAAGEILWYAGRALRSKGYEVEVLESPYGLNVPRAPRESNLARLAPPVPSGADAVMVIRVDHFLDSGLYDRSIRSSLDIYATAALIDPNGRVLWKDEGVGLGSTFPTSVTLYETFQSPAYLADSLFATLPPAKGTL